MSMRFPKLEHLTPEEIEQEKQRIAEDEKVIEDHLQNIEALRNLKHVPYDEKQTSLDFSAGND